MFASILMSLGKYHTPSGCYKILFHLAISVLAMFQNLLGSGLHFMEFQIFLGFCNTHTIHPYAIKGFVVGSQCLLSHISVLSLLVSLSDTPNFIHPIPDCYCLSTGLSFPVSHESSM